MTPKEGRDLLHEAIVGEPRVDLTHDAMGRHRRDRLLEALSALGKGLGGTNEYWRGFHEGQRKAADLLMHVLSEDPIAAVAFLDAQSGQAPEAEPVGAGTGAGILRVARAILGLRGRRAGQ